MIGTLLVLSIGLALADDGPAPAAPDAPAGDPAPGDVALDDPGPETAAPAGAGMAGATTALSVGTIVNVAQKEVLGVGELELTSCIAGAASAPVQPARATSGAVELRVTLKRGKVRLVTATTVDPGLEWLAPCLERQLAAHAWPLKQGVLRVPVTLGLPGERDQGMAP